MSNSIIYYNDDNSLTDITIRQTGTISISYTNVEQGTDNIEIYGDGTLNWNEGNIDADPLFCNADSFDFTLYDNSPCVGTGQDGANMGAFGVGCYQGGCDPPELSTGSGQITSPSLGDILHNYTLFCENYMFLKNQFLTEGPKCCY